MEVVRWWIVQLIILHTNVSVWFWTRLCILHDCKFSIPRDESAALPQFCVIKKSYATKYSQFWAFWQNIVNIFAKDLTSFWTTFLRNKKKRNLRSYGINRLKDYHRLFTAIQEKYVGAIYGRRNFSHPKYCKRQYGPRRSKCSDKTCSHSCFCFSSRLRLMENYCDLQS